MFSIRNNTFETNSSSTHSLVIGPSNDIHAFIKGDRWYDDWGKITPRDSSHLITKKQIIEYVVAHLSDYDKSVVTRLREAEDNSEFNEILEEYDLAEYFRDFEHWNYNGLEWEDGDYTTPGGEAISWVACYGYEG